MTTSIPAITPATIPKFIELFLLDALCFVVGWVPLTGSVGVSPGDVEFEGFSDGVTAVVGFSGDEVNSLFVVAYTCGR